MKDFYERLEKTLEGIKPRNERARSWLNKLILRCLENSRQDLDKFANAASIQSLSYDFEIVMLIQGNDEKQKPLYAEIERLLAEMEAASAALPFR
jgi:hypothetical protein